MIAKSKTVYFGELSRPNIQVGFDLTEWAVPLFVARGQVAFLCLYVSWWSW